MAQVNVIGRITADLELKTSEKSNPYVRFDIAENIGSRQTLHTQYFQVCAWGEDANRLMKAHAKKGSLSFLYDIAAFSDYARNRKNTVYELFEGIRRTMVNIELKGPAVFIGRCSTVILGESPRVLKSFIYSSDTEKRVERIIRTENVSETDAKYLMQKKDRDRKNYFRFWTQKEWADKSNYDILLNTSGVSTEACAQMLLAAISGQPQK